MSRRRQLEHEVSLAKERIKKAPKDTPTEKPVHKNCTGFFKGNRIFSRLPSGMATHKGYTAPSIYQLCNIYNKTELEVLCSASAHVLTVYFHIYLIIQ